MKVAIFNNGGVGNGIIVFPLLKALKGIGKEFSHIENGFLASKESELENMVGMFPSIWRRFLNPEEILEYFSKENIGTIINVRKEIPELDDNYFAFKEIARKNFDVFDLYEHNISNDQSIALQIKQVFENSFGKLDVDWKWLKPKNLQTTDLLIYVGSAIPEKSFSINQVIQIHNYIRSKFNDSKILISSGNNDYEKGLINSASKIITHSNTSFENFSSLEESESRVADSKIILTGDTYMSHLAGASHSLTYTLFTRTKGKIWRHVNQSLDEIFQSNLPLYCDDMKKDGTCKKFYDYCRKCSGQDINFKYVAKIIQENMEVLKQ